MNEAPLSAGVHTATEVSESLTGYEEVGIGQAFGPLDGLEGNMPARALVFVLFKRDGLSHDEAQKAAMSMTARACADTFADDQVEVFEDEPVTDQGKGDEPADERLKN